jgi:hypothetical protein
VRGGAARIAARGFAPRREARTARGQPVVAASRWRDYLVAWVLLIGLIVPAWEVMIYVAGAKFTVGRIGVMLLLVPAVFTLLGKGRRLMLPDLFVCAMAAWYVGAGLYTDGAGALSSAGAEAVEFLGGYAAGRAFFIRPEALRAFLSVLKPLAFTAVVLGMADTITGRMFIHETLASLLHVAPIVSTFRGSGVRAASTFDHAIQFGAFCCLVGAMLLYSERNVVKRIVYVGICFAGTILSWSSSGLMSFAMILAAYAYDRLLGQYPRRWTVFWAAIAVIYLAIMLTTIHPLGWVLTHLTLEPESGYYRLMEWDTATGYISAAPWTGYAFRTFPEAELYSVDCVWLAVALRFGIPASLFLMLANLTAILPNGSAPQDPAAEPFMSQMRAAFTVVLVMFMFIGITAHYWNYIWIFWGICIGIRASLRERTYVASNRSASYSRPVRKRSLASQVDLATSDGHIGNYGRP